ncbi:3-ketoacyl-ACP reductase [Pseudonocardia sp. CNS-139]|nr:3-ketoacyl-ACP reductase [Pseudonocardia sp. CNS-139]
MGRMDGKVVFITGAARGLGRSHAVRLAQEGADVIAVDTAASYTSVRYPQATAGDLAGTVAAVEGLGRRIVAADADVRDGDALAAVVRKGVAELGRLDAVVANAGIATSDPALTMSDEAWQEVIDVNLTGVWKTVKAAVPSILDGGRGGSVVLTSSLAALRPNPGLAHYAASKAGVVMLMKVLAMELGPQRVRVNSIHPTTAATDMVLNDATFRLFRPDLEEPGRADFEQAALRLNRLPVPLLEPVDVSNAVLYLVSDEGRFVTGSTFVIDAGGSL